VVNIIVLLDRPSESDKYPISAKHWIQSVILGIEMFIKGFVWVGAIYNNGALKGAIF
jgi:hypothetical protein